MREIMNSLEMKYTHKHTPSAVYYSTVSGDFTSSLHYDETKRKGHTSVTIPPSSWPPYTFLHTYTQTLGPLRDVKPHTFKSNWTIDRFCVRASRIIYCYNKPFHSTELTHPSYTHTKRNANHTYMDTQSNSV